VTKPTDELLLAIDCGTQSVRALAIDLTGNIVAKTQCAFDDYLAPSENWLEHDACSFWSAAASVCRRLINDHGELKSRIKGVVVTTQRASLALFDASGRPLRPFIIWLDQRRATQIPKVAWPWRVIFNVSGTAGIIRYFQREAELNWLAEHEPEILAQTHKVLLVSGWLNFKLTGRFVDSIGSQVGYIPFDFRRQKWARRVNWKWRALGARRELMPELAPVGATIGALTAEAAEATGLPENLPVIAAAADKACEILGSGAIANNVGAVSYGTTATINVTTRHYVEAIRLVPPYPSALPGLYSCEVQIYRGFWMVSWFKREFGQPEIAAAEEEGQSAEILFDRLVEKIPPGAQGLMLQPYWTPGIRMPGPEARGAIIGFTDAHTRAHLYRAILEGLAYALREGGERIAAKTGVPLASLRVSGGGSQSDVAMQTTADVFNLPASRPHTFETAGLGAAIVGAVALKLHPDYPTAVAAMTRLGRTFEPDAGRAGLYERLYEGVYRRMYGRLGPLNRALGRAMGGG
jgi:sugar (pentulose or hexulose) kinase